MQSAGGYLDGLFDRYLLHSLRDALVIGNSGADARIPVLSFAVSNVPARAGGSAVGRQRHLAIPQCRLTVLGSHRCRRHRRAVHRRAGALFDGLRIDQLMRALASSVGYGSHQHGQPVTAPAASRACASPALWTDSARR